MTRIGIFVAAIGFACLLAFRLIGSTLDLEGFVHEPFGLLPLGYLLVLVGALVAFTGFIRGRIAKRSAQGAA